MADILTESSIDARQSDVRAASRSQVKRSPSNRTPIMVIHHRYGQGEDCAIRCIRVIDTPGKPHRRRNNAEQAKQQEVNKAA